jgi:hypothetical protein
MAAVPNVQLDVSWVLPDSFVTAPPALPVPCGSQNWPDSASLYSQILIWPSGNPAGEVENIQNPGSACLASMQVAVSVDPDCNLATVP